MNRADLGKICVDFLKLPFLKCNENAVFLFEACVLYFLSNFYFFSK